MCGVWRKVCKERVVRKSVLDSCHQFFLWEQRHLRPLLLTSPFGYRGTWQWFLLLHSSFGNTWLGLHLTQWFWLLPVSLVVEYLKCFVWNVFIMLCHLYVLVSKHSFGCLLWWYNLSFCTFFKADCWISIEDS